MILDTSINSSSKKWYPLLGFFFAMTSRPVLLLSSYEQITLPSPGSRSGSGMKPFTWPGIRTRVFCSVIAAVVWWG